MSVVITCSTTVKRQSSCTATECRAWNTHIVHALHRGWNIRPTRICHDLPAPTPDIFGGHSCIVWLASSTISSIIDASIWGQGGHAFSGSYRNQPNWSCPLHARCDAVVVPGVPCTWCLGAAAGVVLVDNSDYLIDLCEPPGPTSNARLPEFAAAHCTAVAHNAEVGPRAITEGPCGGLPTALNR